MHGKVWLLLMRSVPKSAAISLGSDLGVWDMLKLTQQKKKESKGHSALLWAELKQRALLGHLGESFRESKHRKERASAGGAVRKIERNTVRVWESEKRKMRHFSLLKVHTRKINWWSSYGVFGCYNHRELEYSEEDFATGFVIRLYLLLEIYLLYIQFIVNTSLT